MRDRQRVVEAIRQSWSKETSGTPEEWTATNPARGQCDASSFVFWEHFGGALVLAEVYVEGTQIEHHYWNRVDGEDIDLTREQFTNGEGFREKRVLSREFIQENAASMKSDLRRRIDLMRESVAERLAAISGAGLTVRAQREGSGGKAG